MEVSDHAEVFVYEGGNQTVPADVVRARIHAKCKRVETEAFVNRDCLRQLEWSEGLVEICKGAFRGCAMLEHIVTPSTLRIVGESAFAGCLNMKYALLNQRLVTIGKSAFYECCAMKYMYIPPTVTKLGSSAFAKCWALQEVALSPALKNKVFKGTFEDCQNLELIVKRAKIVLVAGALPELTKIDTNYKEASKKVLKNAKELIAEHKKKKANVDVKPTIESTANIELPPGATESSTNELKEMEKELAETEAKLKEKTEEVDALQEATNRHQEESSAKQQKAKEEKDALEAAKSRLEKDNENLLKASKDMEAKLEATTDSLQKEMTEKAGTVARLEEITGDNRVLKAENARLQKDTENKDASLLKWAERFGALKEQSKRLRKKLHSGHNSVVSEENEVRNDLEGISIGLSSAQGCAERSKLSSVTGDEVFQSCLEELASKQSRKRKRSPEDASSKSDEGVTKVLRTLIEEVKKKVLSIQATESNETNASESG